MRAVLVWVIINTFFLFDSKSLRSNVRTLLMNNDKDFLTALCGIIAILILIILCIFTTALLF